jgi:uncharacterized protein YabE (DUF348 family)
MVKRLLHLALSDPVRQQRQKPRLHRYKLLVQHPFAVPVLTIIFLALITSAAFIVLNHHPSSINPNVVVISHDDQQQIVSSKEPTVGTLLEKLNLRLNQGDVVEPALSTLIQQDDFRINIYRAVPVAIIDGGQKQFAFSAATTSRSVARQAGLTVYPEDTIETQPVTDFVADGGIGQELVIDRATPVNVNLYGAPVVMRTHATTVRQLLAEKKINLKPQDIVNPGIDAPITPNAQLAVIRNGVSTVTAQEDIPMPIQVIPDNTLSYGVSAVRQQGAPGKRAVTYEVNTQNGVEVSRKPIQSVIIQQPVVQITVQGANLSGIKGDMALAGIAPGDYTYADYIISHESGWCPTKAQGQYGGCPAYSGSVPSYGGYGLCQSTPGSKMASAGADWATNPVTQLRWCSGYATGRYGSWGAAYDHWVNYHNW